MNPIDRLMLAVQLGDLREASSDLLTTPTDEEFVELLNVALTEQHWRVALQLVHAAPRSCLAREEGAGSLSLAIHRHAPPWVLRSLLSAGVRADLKACGSTPLHAAAARAGLETLRLLLDAGADIETRDISGLSPALVALGKRRLDTLAFLLTQGASVEAEHALTVAISRDSAESVKDLAQGRDLNVADRFGATPLHYAMSIRRPAIVELLLTLGADPELVDDTGNNSLGVAALWATPSVFEVLIRAGTRLDHANKWGNTPLLSLLLYASGEISSDSLACIESLVSAGAAVAPAGFGASDDCALVRTVTAHGGFRDSHARCLALLLEHGGVELLRTRGAAALAAAIRHRHAPAVKLLLEAGLSPDAKGPDGHAPVALAVRAGDADTLSLLLERGAQLPVVDESGELVIVRARGASDPRVAELPGRYGKGAGYSRSVAGLADAIEAGDLLGVEALLAANVDVNAPLPGGGRPLTLAARHGHDAILRACIRHGADVLAPPVGFGSHVLVAAVANGHDECARTLLAVGAGKNQESLDEALLVAAELGNTDLLRSLCAEGADPYQIQRKGRSPLTCAFTASHFETADAVLGLLTDPLRRRRHLKDALRFFVWGRSLEGARFILEQAPDIYDEPDDYTGQSPLEGAAARGHVLLLRLLLGCGPCALEGPTAVPRRWEVDYLTPLMMAVSTGRFGAVRVLVDAGAALGARARRSGFTPLMFACREASAGDSGQIAGYLLKRGAELEARAVNGCTPLLLAAKSGNYDVLETLLRFGADISARDPEGRDVFALAEERGNREIAALLAKHRQAEERSDRPDAQR